MKMQYFSILAMLMTFIAVSHAQTEPKARKFAEFSAIRAEELKKTIESFCYETKKSEQPQGYIINYGTLTAVKVRRKEIFLSTGCFYTYDPPRITWVDGPRRKKIWTVLWLVPPGATPPTP